MDAGCVEARTQRLGEHAGGRRRVLRGSRRLCLGAAICALIAAALAPGPAAAEARNEPTIRALVLHGAKSPVLRALGKIADLKAVPPSEATTSRPQDYDLLIVDSDPLSFRELDTKSLIERFTDAGRWVMVLNPTGRDQNAIDDQTGVDLSVRKGEDGGAMFLYGISRSDGLPRMAMVDSGSLAPYGAKLAADRLLERLRQDAAESAARSAANAIGQDQETKVASRSGTAAPRAVSAPCVPASLLCADSAQVDRYSFDRTKEFVVLPDGYWHGQGGAFDGGLYTSPKGNQGQVASWKQDLWFDVGLENDDSPTGDNQVVFYESNLSFTPADNTPFWQMNKPFGFYFDPADYFLERAWWTGTVGVDVTPVTATAGFLAPYPTPGTPAIPASQPQTSNGETQYSVGHDFSLSVTAAKPDGGGGATASYTYSNQQSYSVSDWSFQNTSGAGSRYAWQFYAANPCDVRDDNHKDACFSYLTATQPKPSSTSTIQVPTWGRWKACAPSPQVCNRPLTSNEKLSFDFATPVQVIDTYLAQAPRAGYERKLRRQPIGPATRRISFDPSTVNPCPDATYTAGGACKPVEKIELLHANGSKVTQSDPARVADAGTTCENEVITGRVTLAKKVDRQKAASGTKVILWSDGANAKLVDGSPVVSNPGETTRTIVVPNGQRSADFQIRTNANGLTEGKPSTEGTITAFFVQPATEGGQLPIRRKPDSVCPPR